ncbi:MAG: carbohydrate ABC transporter permease [Lachnospiraceae bacterium]|nr:carbohydrate ABC transporter permease [Lachnospiraceae bacterium]
MYKLKPLFVNSILAIFIFSIALVSVLPIISVFINSFVDPTMGSLLNSGAAKVIFKPFPISIKQYYAAILENRETTIFFWNTVKLAAPILIGGILIALPSGYALAKFDFPFKRFLFFCYVLIMLLPIQINVVGTYIFFRNLELVGKHIGVILPGIFSPFGAFLIYQFMKTVPLETMESARLDGASEIRILFKIVIPQVKAGITSMLVLILIDCWNMVEMPMTILNEERLFPMSIMLRYITATDPKIVFAFVALFSIPLLLIFLLAQDNLTEGIARSAVIK